MPLKENSNVTHSSPRNGRHDAAGRATGGGNSYGQGAARSKGKAYAPAFTWICTGKGRQGRGNSLGLAGWNDAAGLWGIKAVPCCLVPGAEVDLEQEKYWFGACYTRRWF